MRILFGVIVVIFLIRCISSAQIDAVDDTDLVHLITGETNVIALFSKPNCEACDEIENILENIQDDLKEQLDAVVVKAINSHMTGIYSPSREPALVFFRRGLPLLYHGPIAENDIMHTFEENRDPAVKELSDHSFEHLTQAATGATTGDCYSNDCIICQRLYAVWEAVAATLKRKLNVARINRLEYGIATAKRFKVKASPEFLYIRQGKYYRYRQKEYNPTSFIQFAENIHLQKTKAEIVPPVASPMGDFLNDIKPLLNNQRIIAIGSIGLVGAITIGVLCKSLCKKKISTEEKKKKKAK